MAQEQPKETTAREREKEKIAQEQGKMAREPERTTRGPGWKTQEREQASWKARRPG